MATEPQNIDLQLVFNILGIIALFIIALKLIFSAIANRYVEKHKNLLFDINNLKAQKNRDLGYKLLNDMDTYMKYIDELGLNKEYRCSSSIVSNASNNVVKYLIKYSNIDISLYCLECIDFCSNYMQSLDRLQIDMNSLLDEINCQLPRFVRLFAAHKKIPYTVCSVSYQLEKIKNPEFRFLYVSPAGKSRRTYEIEITTNILKSVQSEISSKVEKTGHSKRQRSAMTNDLREAVKKRDNYTCCICGNSVFDEPNLLLEVDHIIPISKGGKTDASNLQTLCWRCNRKKSNK